MHSKFYNNKFFITFTFLYIKYCSKTYFFFYKIDHIT